MNQATVNPASTRGLAGCFAQVGPPGPRRAADAAVLAPPDPVQVQARQGVLGGVEMRGGTGFDEAAANVWKLETAVTVRTPAQPDSI